MVCLHGCHASSISPAAAKAEAEEEEDKEEDTAEITKTTETAQANGGEALDGGLRSVFPAEKLSLSSLST